MITNPETLDDFAFGATPRRTGGRSMNAAGRAMYNLESEPEPSTASKVARGLSTVGKVASGVGIGLDILSTVFNVYDSIISHREAREEKKKAEERYNQQLATEAKRYQDEVDRYQQDFGLRRAEAIARMKADREASDRYNEQDKYNKMQTYTNHLFAGLNDDSNKNRFLAIMKGGR